MLGLSVYERGGGIRGEERRELLFSVMADLIPPGWSEYRWMSSNFSTSISFCVQAVRLINAALLAQ